MLKQIKSKLKSKRGISKESTYDILGFFLIITIFIIVAVSNANKLVARGENNSTLFTNVETEIKNKTFNTNITTP